MKKHDTGLKQAHMAFAKYRTPNMVPPISPKSGKIAQMSKGAKKTFPFGENLNELINMAGNMCSVTIRFVDKR